MNRIVTVMMLYRMAKTLDPWLGFGSYWAEEIEVAKQYGSGRHIFRLENPDGKKLIAKDDHDLVRQLNQLGVPDADEVVDELDWYELKPVRLALEKMIFNGLSNPSTLLFHFVTVNGFM